MRIDLRAIPQLVNSAPIPGAGAQYSEAQWSERIDSLRPRFLALSYRELCHLLRQMELGDLVGLVISPPFGQALLDKLQEGLSEAVAEMLVKDCRQYGERFLGVDLARGTYTRSVARLAAIEAERASPEQIAKLVPLAQQLAALADTSWYEKSLPISLLAPLTQITGGLEGPFGQRILELGSEGFRKMFMEDYAADAGEPVSKELADEALVGIPALIVGNGWPVQQVKTQLSSEELDAWEAEVEASDNKANEGI